jgi:type I restriction enzyme, R subunit
LVWLKEVSAAEQAKQRKEIMDMLSGEVQLRSKRELIEKFINENLPIIEDADDVKEEFDAYWEAERQKGFETIWKEEKLNPEGLQGILSDYLFSDRKPLRDDVIKILEVKPKLLERKSIGERIIDKIVGYVDTFFNGMEG